MNPYSLQRELIARVLFATLSLACVAGAGIYLYARHALVQQYEHELDLRSAAAEVGLRPTELDEKIRASAALMRTLGTLRVPEGTVQRQVFTEAFPALVQELGLGRYLPAKDGAPSR